jgi:predicted  nucleic acid-binding Zn-ribbon protein
MARHAKLAYQTPDGVDQELLIDPANPITIGRHPECAITVSQPSVSRRHARVWFEGGVYCVEDLGSSNGTYINNQRVTKATLTDGSELRCGDFLMRFSLLADRTSSERVAVAPPAQPAAQPRVVGSLRPRRADEPAGIAPRPTQQAVAEVAPMLKPVGPLDPNRRVEDAPQPRSTGPAHEGAAELRSAVADRDRELEERTRRIHDLEGEVRRLAEQLKTQTDRALRLHEQTADLQGQLETSRRDRADVERDLESTREALEEFRAGQLAAGARELELAEAINDLKREVSQREKARRDIERELQLVEYDLKAAREENENLQLAFGSDDSARKDLNTRINDLSQVLMEKEGMIETLQRDVQRLEDQLAQTREAAKQEGGQRTARLIEQMTQLQAEKDAQAEQLRGMTAEIERVKAEAAESGAGRARELQEQLNKLKRENRDLRGELDAAKAAVPAAPSGGGELEAALAAATQARDAARAEVSQLKARMEALAAQAQAPAPAQAPAAAASGGDTAALLAAAVRTYQALNDLASDLRNNIRVGGEYVKELAGLLSVVVSDPGNGEAIRAAMETVDAELTLDSANETLGNAQKGATDFKKLMTDFRKVLQQHGFEG